MKTIAVIGANGQVGSEVCLYLSHMEGIRVVPITRTRLGAAFLRRCGLACRVGPLDSPESARELFEGCQVVADFSLPKGMAFQARAATRSVIASAIAHAPAGASFVYMSNYMACGIPSDSPFMRRYLFSHTTYGAMKREGERFAIQLGDRASRDVYALRLGQVHGELQTVTRQALSRIGDRPATLPTTAHDIVFAFSIAEALRNIALGKERPGLYTLLSEPAWTWADLYGYYARQAGVDPKFNIQPDPPVPGIGNRFRSFLRRNTFDRLLSIARAHRELITAYVLVHFPRVEERLKASYSTGNAQREIAALCDAELYKPFSSPIGRVLGKRLRSLSDSRQTMEPAAQAVRQHIARLLQKNP